MNPADLFRRYQEMQQYVGWTDDDARRVQALAALLDADLPALIDDFYEEIDRHPEARKVITGGAAQVARLKGTLLKWLRELLSGPYDAAYVARRWQVGWRHVDIGLDQVYTNVALSRLRRGLMSALDRRWKGSLADQLVARFSLNILIDLDLAIIEDAYQSEYLSRQQRGLHRLLSARVTEWKALLDVIPIGIAIAQDAAGRCMEVNAHFARLLQLPPSANASPTGPLGEQPGFQVLRHGRELPAAEQPLQCAAAEGAEVRDMELDIVFPDGETINLIAHAAPLFDEQGQARGAVGAFVDNTERKRTQERALQTERLAAIGQMMTGLAHESGNALARSQACLEMLMFEVEDRPEALDLISRIQKAQNHLRQLYEEVRGYAAPLLLERERWDVSRIWRQAWEHLAIQRRGKNAALEEKHEGIELSCLVDHFRLEQVFRNILDNALAACAEPVRIRITCAETTLDDRPAFRIGVRDNGPGLTADQRRRIFEPFFTTKAKGTGLGMAIAKRIVEAHGGRIAVGTPATGAEIIVTLPREIP
jgi:signal transduction histidine kinase